jgi:hypothetical protein
LSSTPNVDDMMAAYATDGVEYAANTHGVELDYSEASVERVEALLAKLFDSRPKGFVGRLLGKGPSPEQIDLLAKAIGGYVGEVMRRNWGGRWKLESAAFPGQAVITLELANGADVWPHFKVGKRLTNGPEDNVLHYFRVMREKYASPRAGV